VELLFLLLLLFLLVAEVRLGITGDVSAASWLLLLLL